MGMIQIIHIKIQGLKSFTSCMNKGGNRNFGVDKFIYVYP
jgi:hypothetical protein